MSCYVFRVDNGEEFIQTEINNGRLRQGWGTKNLYLRDLNGQEISLDMWKKGYEWEDEEDYKKRKYNNLRNMLEMKVGDIIVIPRVPKYSEFTIARVNKSYEFDHNGFRESKINDFGHIIGIDKESIKVYDYGQNEKIKKVTSKLGSYQNPVNNIWNEGLKESIDNLYNSLNGLENDYVKNEAKKENKNKEKIIEKNPNKNSDFIIKPIELNIEGFEKTLEKVKYIVPIYQRNYSWGEKEINRFLEDLMENFCEINEAENKIILKEKNMFLGTIQLSENENSEHDIIDGQQRLTTLNLLRIYLGDKDLRYFETEVGGQQELINNLYKAIEKEEENYSEFNLEYNVYERNYKFIADFFQNKDIEIYREELKEYIQKKVVFISIKTKASLTETLKIFDTINTSGLDLNGADIFKIKMYEYLKEKQGKSNKIFEEIDDIYKTVEDRSKKFKVNINMNKILDIYKDYLISKYELGSYLFKRGSSIFFEKVFDGILKNKYDTEFMSKENINKIVLSLEDLHKLITAVFKWEEIKKSLSTQTIFEENYIYWSRYSKYYRGVYYYLLSNDDTKKLELFINKLSRLFVIYSVGHNRYVNKMINFIRDIFTDLVTKNNIDDVLKKIDEKIKEGYKEEDFKNRLSEPMADQTTAKNLLCRIDGMFFEDLKDENKETLIKKFFYEDIDIEHIQAYNDKEDREKILEKWGDEINKLGNLVVLESSINRSISNNNYRKKKLRYKESNYKIIHTLKGMDKEKVEEKDQWEKDDASKRGEEVRDRILNYLYEGKVEHIKLIKA